MKKRIIPIICTAVAAVTAGTALAAGVKISQLTNYGSLIDIKTAIDLAVDETGLYSDEVFVTKAELDKEKGVAVYEIELVTKDGKAEYDINAIDGTVVTGKKQPAANNSTLDKNLEEAKKIAFKHAGVNSSNVTVKKAKLDRDDGVFVYEIEFYTADYEYEYEISADGKILEYSTKAIKKPVSEKVDGKPADKPISQGNVDLEAAKKIAVDHAKVDAKNIMIKKAKLDKEDGISVYEIEFYTASHEYEYEIDAATGRIIDFDVEDRD